MQLARLPHQFWMSTRSAEWAPNEGQHLDEGGKISKGSAQKIDPLVSGIIF